MSNNKQLPLQDVKGLGIKPFKSEIYFSLCLKAVAHKLFLLFSSLPLSAMILTSLTFHTTGSPLNVR